MSINMIERNGSDCKYVEIFTPSFGNNEYKGSVY
jgi:hypothetical protein